MTSARYSLAFSVSTGIVKKLLKNPKKLEEKYNKIVMLATSKLNRTESKITKALINNGISHEDLDMKTITNEEKNIKK